MKYDQGYEKFKLYLDSKSQTEQDKYYKEAMDIWKDGVKDLESSLALAHLESDKEDLIDAYQALAYIYYQFKDPEKGKKYEQMKKDLQQNK